MSFTIAFGARLNGNVEPSGMADMSANFADPSRKESPGANAICLRAMGSEAVVVAPHRGAIEPVTTRIAPALAGTDLTYCLIEGSKPKASRDLHMTSNNFNEPQCVRNQVGDSRHVAIASAPARAARP